MIVNNGITNLKYDGASSAVEMAYYRGLISNKLWDDVQAANCDFSKINAGGQATPAVCAGYYDQFLQMTLGSNINPFNIYKDCQLKPTASEEVIAGSKFSSDILGADLPCIFNSEVTEYLRQSKVRTDLHIDDAAQKWTMCNNEAIYSFDSETMTSYD